MRIFDEFSLFRMSREMWEYSRDGQLYFEKVT